VKEGIELLRCDTLSMINLLQNMPKGSAYFQTKNANPPILLLPVDQNHRTDKRSVETASQSASIIIQD
jgi:hypothetical protein